MVPANSSVKRKIPQHSDFEFIQSNGQTVKFSSRFDSGNCGKVSQISSNEYLVEAHEDFDSSTQTGGYSKSWFHFRVQGLKGRVKFHIPRMKMLNALAQSGSASSYKPVYRHGELGEFSRLPENVSLSIEGNNQAKLTFSFDFDSSSLEKQKFHTYFAFSYPYSYARNIQFIELLRDQYDQSNEIYFNREVLTFTPHLRKVHLLTISSHDYKTQDTESYLSEGLFPSREYETRAIRFKNHKPVILISARVHPGETPASYALEGLIKFLLSSTDLRAALLRKFFTFWIIPMLNPDGVFCGHYRMDIFNQNLNRYYQVASNIKQPAIYAMRQIFSYLASEERLLFYLDIHSHARKKGAFVYGNALDDFASQVETQLFAKLMGINDPSFEYTSCNFSKAQMKAKDKADEMSKEGCGRVYANQMTKAIHCFTLECGFHHGSSPSVGNIPDYTNKEFVVQNIDGREYILDEQDKETPAGITKDKDQIDFFTIESFQHTGKAALISLLDAFEKNPYTRVQPSLENLRKETAQEVARSERIRMEDAQAYSKAKNIENLIQEGFFNKIINKGYFKLREQIKWPSNTTELMMSKHTKQYASIFAKQQQQQQQKQLPLMNNPTQTQNIQFSSPQKLPQKIFKKYIKNPNTTAEHKNESLTDTNKTSKIILNGSNSGSFPIETDQKLKQIEEEIEAEKKKIHQIKHAVSLHSAAPFVHTASLLPKTRNMYSFFIGQHKRMRKSSLYDQGVNNSNSSEPSQQLPFDMLSVQATKCKTDSERRNSMIQQEQLQQQIQQEQLFKPPQLINSKSQIFSSSESLPNISPARGIKTNPSNRNSLKQTTLATLAEILPNNINNSTSIPLLFQVHTSPPSDSTKNTKNPQIFFNSLNSSLNCSTTNGKDHLLAANQNTTMIQKLEKRRIEKIDRLQKLNWRIIREPSGIVNDSISQLKTRIEQAKLQAAQLYCLQFQDQSIFNTKRISGELISQRLNKSQLEQQQQVQQQQQQTQEYNSVKNTLNVVNNQMTKSNETINISEKQADNQCNFKKFTRISQHSKRFTENKQQITQKILKLGNTDNNNNNIQIVTDGTNNVNNEWIGTNKGARRQSMNDQLYYPKQLDNNQNIQQKQSDMNAIEQNQIPQNLRFLSKTQKNEWAVGQLYQLNIAKNEINEEKKYPKIQRQNEKQQPQMSLISESGLTADDIQQQYKKIDSNINNGQGNSLKQRTPTSELQQRRQRKSNTVHSSVNQQRQLLQEDQMQKQQQLREREIFLQSRLVLSKITPQKNSKVSSDK